MRGSQGSEGLGTYQADARQPKAKEGVPKSMEIFLPKKCDGKVDANSAVRPVAAGNKTRQVSDANAARGARLMMRTLMKRHDAEFACEATEAKRDDDEANQNDKQS